MGRTLKRISLTTWIFIGMAAVNLVGSALYLSLAGAVVARWEGYKAGC
jgi:hypothetical protein